eukprot:PITA_33489
MQGNPQSSSQGSPLLDSSHGTSASTGIDSGLRSVGRPLGVQAPDDDEDSFTLVGEVYSRKRKPKWLQDTLLMRRQPTSRSGERPLMEEYSSIMKNDVWEVVPRPESKLVVTSIWLYKIKHAIDGIIEKFKARFVARGFSQVEGVDYEETFTLVARYTSICFIISIATDMGWNIHQMDVKTAFHNGFI